MPAHTLAARRKTESRAAWPAAKTSSSAAISDVEVHRVTSVATGRVDAPVLDKEQMSMCVAQMGAKWVDDGLRRFALHVEGRLTSLATVNSSELAAITHGMIMMAHHCGFAELAKVSDEIQCEARLGAGLERVPELRAAAERALAIMRSDSPVM